MKEKIRKERRRVKSGRRQRSKRTKGQFVAGLRKGIEERDRISLVKESNLYYSQEGKKERTVTGSAIPSLKTRYVEGLIGMSSDKLYGEKAYLKGMNKRPRMKLTLGNMVMRKKRKRVEGVNQTSSGQLKDARVGGQRVRQTIRVVWDRINREIRKKYKAYRRDLREKNPEIKQDRKIKDSRKKLVDTRARYLVVRECEVYRNSYEVRSRFETHERGERRKKWRLEGKYKTQVREKNRSRTKTWLETHVRENRRREEADQRNPFYANRRIELKKEFEKKYEARKQRVGEKKQRTELSHIRTLLNRSERTSQTPIQQKNREQRFKFKKVEEREGVSKSAESGVLGREEFERKDNDGEILMASPTTQYFAKVKNLVRRMEIRSSVEKKETKEYGARGKEENGSSKENREEKRKKVPEKKRNVRYPNWMELDAWSNRLMQKVENENLKKVLKGEEVNLSYATYREFGKKVRYLYAVERTERKDVEIENQVK